MPLYLNFLKGTADRKYVSSRHIAEALGLGEVLVRKDLAYTSANGRPRVGYVTEELVSAIEECLCCNGRRNTVIVGFGALGKALLGYDGFIHYGIEVVAAFDNNPARTGVLQEVCGLLIDCGIKAVLNFAPVTLKVPDGVQVIQIDVAANLAILSSSIR